MFVKLFGTCSVIVATLVLAAVHIYAIVILAVGLDQVKSKDDAIVCSTTVPQVPVESYCICAIVAHALSIMTLTAIGPLVGIYSLVITILGWIWYNNGIQDLCTGPAMNAMYMRNKNCYVPSRLKGASVYTSVVILTTHHVFGFAVLLGILIFATATRMDI